MNETESYILKKELEEHPRYQGYLRWKKKYSHVYKKFQEETLKLINRRRRFGMWLVAGKIRWDYAFEYDTQFKICNDYIALITRELMLEIPQLQKYCTTHRITKC